MSEYDGYDDYANEVAALGQKAEFERGRLHHNLLGAEWIIAFGVFLVAYRWAMILIKVTILRGHGELGLGGLVFMLVALPPAGLAAGLFMSTVTAKFSNDLRKRLSIDTAAVLAFLLFFVWPVRQDAAAEHAAAVTRASELAARMALMDNERRQRERDEAAWLEALRTGDRHRPPGMVPPLLRVTDHGHRVIVENISGKPLHVALALVQKDVPDERWLRCGMYYQPWPDAPKEDFSLIPVGGHKLYVPQQSCVLAFEDAVIEYRVGSGPGEPTWWSDSAVAARAGRDSDFLLGR